MVTLPNAIGEDASKNRVERLSLAITCLDQLDSNCIKLNIDGIIADPHINEFMKGIEELLPLYQTYVTFGPTRSTVSRRERVV